MFRNGSNRLSHMRAHHMDEYDEYIREHGKSNRGRKPSVLRLVLDVDSITEGSAHASENADGAVAPQ